MRYRRLKRLNFEVHAHYIQSGIGGERLKTDEIRLNFEECESGPVTYQLLAGLSVAEALVALLW